MWKNQKVSVILPTYNEKESIRSVIEGFCKTGVIDEVLVINNNAAPGTSEEVAKTSAWETHEPKQGYGFAIRRGLREATGDLLIISEPDGTFEPNDIFKFLAYVDDFDIVFGSRTSSHMIWVGANMGFFLKWGNWAMAKLMEFLFLSAALTDAGCTMKLLKRKVLRKIEPHFRVGGSHFNPELMILCILSGLRHIEIPVNYKPRIGKSMVTGNPVLAVLLGLEMLVLILWYRIRTLLGWSL